MNYQFESVRTFVFDVHTTIKPFLAASMVNKDFEFLFDPAQYKAFFTAKKPLETANLRLRPLRAWRRPWNHFWKAIFNIWHDASEDAWLLQAPLECYAKDFTVKAIPKDDLVVRVRPIIYLSAIGWSSNLELSVSGDLTLGKVADLLAYVRDPSAQCFQVNGNPTNLSGVMGLLTSKVKKDVFIGSAQQPDILKVARYFVVGAKGAGEQAVPLLSDAGIIEIQSLLSGRTVKLSDLKDTDTKKKYTLVRYNKSDFALSDFEYGTFLFVSPRTRAKRKATLRCLSSNIRSCIMTMLKLTNFYKDSKPYAAAGSKTAELRTGIALTLRQLPGQYTNELCLNWYLNNNNFAEFLN